jgi:hypothetical protein
MRTAINTMLAAMRPDEAKRIVDTVLADEDPPFTVPGRDTAAR